MPSIKDKKRKELEAVIRREWSSLESHLPYTHCHQSKTEIKASGSKRFHIKCCKDYAENIKTLVEQL